MKKIIIYLLVNIFLISLGFAHGWTRPKCPILETSRPCYCDDEYSVRYICENITNDDDFITAMTALKKHIRNSEEPSFEMRSVSLRYLPEDIFEGTGLQHLTFFNSSLLSLSNGEYAFKGLENSLKVFRVENCTYVNQWDWTQLKTLKKMEKFQILYSTMLEISDEFIKVTSEWPLLGHILLGGNNIDSMPPTAFSKFEELRVLILQENSLKSVERSQFPKPAKYLWDLSLSSNDIRVLPIDIFTEMPKLTYLSIGDNPILMLDERTFKPVWSNLKMFIFSDLLHCDCKVSWIFSRSLGDLPENGRYVFHARCNTPANLRGRNPAYLKKEDFRC